MRRWRAEGAGFPILVLSARGAWTTRAEAIDAGADDHLGKPFTMEELLARLRAVPPTRCAPATSRRPMAARSGWARASLAGCA